MNFEANVLSQISTILASTDQAEFSFGTLFVACEENTARTVFHKLSEISGLGRVKISKTPAEYAFDFV